MPLKGSQHPGILDEIGRRLGQLIYAGEGGARLQAGCATG